MYDYRKEMKNDIEEYIRENVNKGDYSDKDEAYEALNDDLWTADSVTGNGSGSYTFSRSTAKEYVTDNIELATEALREFCTPAEDIADKFLNEDWEYFDVSIRCYLLGEVLGEALEELEDEGFFEEEEEPEEVNA